MVIRYRPTVPSSLRNDTLPSRNHGANIHMNIAPKLSTANVRIQAVSKPRHRYSRDGSRQAHDVNSYWVASSSSAQILSAFVTSTNPFNMQIIPLVNTISVYGNTWIFSTTKYKRTICMDCTAVDSHRTASAAVLYQSPYPRWAVGCSNQYNSVALNRFRSITDLVLSIGGIVQPNACLINEDFVIMYTVLLTYSKIVFKTGA